MTERCTVKKVKRGYAYIELVHTDRCNGCNICSFNKRKSITAPAVCDLSVSPGDLVDVTMPTRSVGAGSLLVYALPLVLIVLGACIGLAGGIWLQVSLAATGLIAGLLAAWIIDKSYRKRTGVLPVVVAVVKKEGASVHITNEQKGEDNGT